mgnify:FL=1
MQNPKVSVLLPTYNGGRFITKSIESVLKQSFKDLELIVIDDGSSDHAPDIVREFIQKDSRVLFVQNEENLGIQKTLNKGLGIARGEYIARVDDDDEWIDVHKLESQVDFLDNDQSHVLVGTGVVFVDEKREELFRFLQPVEDKSIRDRMLFKSCFMHSAVLFRKSVAVELGGYSEKEEHKHVEDYALWLGLGKIGKLHNMPSYGIKFMLRDGAISAVNKKEQFRKNIELVKRFKHDYPHALKALWFVYLRFFSYSIYKLVPSKFLKHSILKIYKKI